MPFTTLTLRYKYEWRANVMDTTWVSDDVNKQKFKFKTKVKQLLPLLFRRLSRNMNVYSKELH